VSGTGKVFYAVGAVTFGLFSWKWFSEGSTGWGIFGAAVAMYDLARLVSGLSAVKHPGKGAPPPPALFGLPGPDSVTVEIRVTGREKIEAIKALREAVPGLGLKDAKDVVDAAMENGTAVLTRAASPGQRERLRESLRAAEAGIEVVGEG